MRQIIIVDVEPDGNGGSAVVAAFWFQRQSATSRPMQARKISSIVPNITKSELADLQSAAVIERVVRTGSLSPAELAAITTTLQEMYAAELAKLGAEQATHSLIGSEWDGRGWSAALGRFEPPPAELEPQAGPETDPNQPIVAALADVVQRLEVLIEIQGSK